MTSFSRRLMQNTTDTNPEIGPVAPIDPTVEAFRNYLRALFGDVRSWLREEETV